MQALINANVARSVAASARQVEQARKALEVLRAWSPQSPRMVDVRRRYMAVLRMRINYPDHTLAEIAELMRVTKDLYAARLRRALRYAEKKG